MSFKLGLYDPEKTYPEQNSFDGENAVINKSTVGEFEAASQKKYRRCVRSDGPESKGPVRRFFPLMMSFIDNTLVANLVTSMPQQIPCTRLAMLGETKNTKAISWGLDCLILQAFRPKNLHEVWPVEACTWMLMQERLVFTQNTVLGRCKSQQELATQTPFFLFLESFS